MAQQPRGFRNNNPGNIEYGQFAQGQGAVGSDGRFAVFPDMDAGRRAMVSLLRSYAKRGFNTPNSMINRWAPPSDGNPTSAYAGDVAKAIGIGGDDPVNVDDEAIMGRMTDAMVMRENGSLPTGSAPIGTTTAGGVTGQAAANTLAGGEGNDQLAGGDGMDRLKKLLGMSYDDGKLSEAEALMKRGDEAAKGAQNWGDVANSALASFGGAYKKSQEGARKTAYGEEQRQGLANAQDATAVARLLMASPDEATQLKGAAMLRQAEKDKADAAEAAARLAKANQKSFNKSPTLAVKNGKVIAVQFNDAGEAVETPLPQGVELSEKLLQVDTGLGTDLVGGTTHQTVGARSKNVAAVQEQEEAGKNLAKAKDALPGVETNVNRLLKTIGKIERSDVKDRFTGLQGAYGPNLTSAARDFQGLLDQLQGGTFVAGFGDLRGGGAITEIEGVKAQAALNRLQVLGPSDKGFAEALEDARQVFQEIQRNARTRAGMAPADMPPPAPGEAPDAGGGDFTVLRRRP